jgi:adenylylsulfate kinase
MKILICGLPGSGKSTLAKSLSEELGAYWLNADAVRTEYNDWDFSEEGRMRQADRMKFLADTLVKAGQNVVADFICPTKETRDYFDADFTIWMDTISRGRYEDTNDLFEPPEQVDYHIEKWFNDTHEVLLPVLERFRKYNK